MKRVALHIRRFPISELPQDEEELGAWLKARWAEKDELLDHYYKHGVWGETSPSDDTQERDQSSAVQSALTHDR